MKSNINIIGVTSIVKIFKTVLSFSVIFNLILIIFIGILNHNGVIDTFSVAAVTIYVDPSGTGDCLTLQEALDKANPNDIIIVANGTYNESITINKANITLIGNSSTDCKIIHYYAGTDSFNDYAAGINITAPGITITGLNISVNGRYTFGIHLNPFSLNSNISNNNITSYGSGIFFHQSSNNLIANNMLVSYGNGIDLQPNSNNNRIKNNDIVISGFGHGIIIQKSTNIDIIKNQIQISRINYYGIYLSDTVCANLEENHLNACRLWLSGERIEHWNTHNIDTTNKINNKPIYYYRNKSSSIIPSNAVQVILGNCSNMRISNHIFETFGVQMAFTQNSIINNSQFNKGGIFLYYSNKNNISGNIINTDWEENNSIYLWRSNENSISNNLIHPRLTNRNYCIFLSQSLRNTINNNNIIYSARGIYLLQSSYNYIISTQIDVNVKFTNGICLSYSSNNYLIANFVRVSGWGTQGILLSYSSNNILENNNVTSEICIYLSHSTKNEFRNNQLSTPAHGFLLGYVSNDNILNGDKIETETEQSHGVYISGSKNNILINCEIATTGPESHGIYLDGFYATIIDTTISTLKDAGSYDIYIINDGEMSVIGTCEFKTFYLIANGGGVLNFKNYVGVQVYHDDGITPIPGVDVEVNVNEKRLHASPGYDGTDNKTNASGEIEPLLITYRSYKYRNYNPQENVISVKVKKLMNSPWERIRPNIDMSTSHTEFFYYDTNPPSIPTGLKITRVPDTNTLKIYWDLNPDTVNYALYSNRTGQWEFVSNTTYPQNWTLDEALQDCIWYYYRLQAWDKGELCSDLSEIVHYYLTDITPPITPTGLIAKPVPGGDALNISWELNPDNPKCYDLVWKDPITGEWTWLDNVTHPKNWYILSDKSLINGTKYYFKVRACYQDIFPSQYSLAANVIHRDYLAPEPPSNFRARASSESVIELNWGKSKSLDVVAYLIYVNQSKVGLNRSYVFLDKIDILSLNYELTGLAGNTQYFFRIKAIDEANNPSLYSNESWNTTIGIPHVVNTNPARNSVGVAVDSSVTITFNMPMNRLTVKNVLDISPVIQYDLSWLKNNTKLQIDFINNFSYNTSYIITIGMAKSEAGLVLKNHPFILQFITIEEKKIQPRIFKIDILHPKNGTIVKPGKEIEVIGTSFGFENGTLISVTLVEITEFRTIDINGNWSVSIKVPDVEGNYSIRISVGVINNSIYIIVKSDDEVQEENEEDKKEKDNFDEIMIIILFMIIIILIIAVMVFIMIKKKSSEKVQKDKQKKVRTHRNVIENTLNDEE